MTMKSARILTIILGLIIFIGLVVMGIYSLPMSKFVKEYVLVPWLSVLVSFFLFAFILPYRNRVVISNKTSISSSQFRGMILYPVIIGCIGFIYLGFKHTVVGINWIFFAIAISIEFIALDIYQGKGTN